MKVTATHKERRRSLDRLRRVRAKRGRKLPPCYEWTLVKGQQIVVPISVSMRAQIGRSSFRMNYADFCSLTSLFIPHVKRIGSGFNARDHLLPRPFPSSLRITQVRNMFVGAKRMGLGDAGHLCVCHIMFLSELALLDFGVNFNLTRAYLSNEARYRHH